MHMQVHCAMCSYVGTDSRDSSAIILIYCNCVCSVWNVSDLIKFVPTAKLLQNPSHVESSSPFLSSFLLVPIYFCQYLPRASFQFSVATSLYLIRCSHLSVHCSVCVCAPGWVMYFGFHINWLAIMIYKMQLVQFTHRMYVFTKYKWHSQIMLCEMISIAAHQFQFKCMRKAFVALSHWMKCVCMCWWRCQSKSKSKSALLDTVLHCAHARNKSKPTKATRTN